MSPGKGTQDPDPSLRGLARQAKGTGGAASPACHPTRGDAVSPPGGPRGSIRRHQERDRAWPPFRAPEANTRAFLRGKVGIGPPLSASNQVWMLGPWEEHRPRDHRLRMAVHVHGTVLAPTDRPRMSDRAHPTARVESRGRWGMSPQTLALVLTEGPGYPDPGPRDAFRKSRTG